MSRSCLTAVFLALVAAGPAAQDSTRAAAEVAAALQRHYNTVHDFSANFTHQHTGGVLRRKIVEQGTVQVKKPGRMRWEYKSPEEKLFVSDGRRLYFFDPTNNQVTVSPVPEGDQPASAAHFLSGRGNLLKDFDVSFTEGGSGDAYGLKLDPRAPQNEYEWLEIVVDRSSLRLRSLTAVENQGARSTFLFSDLKENIGLSDDVFEFDIPRGVEVIHAGPPKY